MDTVARREEILRILESSDGCISANQFAERFGVTRQIIVSDIALLRANGHRISAGRYGYRLESENVPGRFESIVCRHSGSRVLDEFYAVVDNGGCVVSVVIEHPIYGEISAELNISSRYEAREFVRRMQSENAAPLSDLTGGLHIHMIRVPDEETCRRIKDDLRTLGILADEEES